MAMMVFHKCKFFGQTKRFKEEREDIRHYPQTAKSDIKMKKFVRLFQEIVVLVQEQLVNQQTLTKELFGKFYITYEESVLLEVGAEKPQCC